MLYNVKEYGLYTGTAGAAVTLYCRSLDVAAEARLVLGGVELVTVMFSDICAVTAVTTELLLWRAAVS